MDTCVCRVCGESKQIKPTFAGQLVSPRELIKEVSSALRGEDRTFVEGYIYIHIYIACANLDMYKMSYPRSEALLLVSIVMQLLTFNHLRRLFFFASLDIVIQSNIYVPTLPVGNGTLAATFISV